MKEIKDDLREIEEERTTALEDAAGKEHHADWSGIFSKLRKNWKTLLIWALASAVVGFCLAWSTPREYESYAVVAPELTTRSQSGGLTSLANLAGINVNSLAVTDAMHPDLYPEIIGSTAFTLKLLGMDVDFDTDEGPVRTTLYDYMLNHTKAPWWSFVMAAPGNAVNWVKSLFDKSPEEEESGIAHVDSLRLTREQEGIIKALSKALDVKVEKRTYVLHIRVRMQDRMVAAQVANAVTENLQRFVIDYRTSKSRHNLEYYEKLCEDARVDYYAAQSRYARYVDANQGVVRQSVLVEKQRLQSEASRLSSLYNSFSQQVLTARAKVQEETPVLVTIQPAMAPNDGKPSKVRQAFLFFVLGLGLGAVWVLWKKDR